LPGSQLKVNVVVFHGRICADPGSATCSPMMLNIYNFWKRVLRIEFSFSRNASCPKTPMTST
jgi:hypothetical protein